MDRSIPQPGALVLVEDVLDANRDAMVNDGGITHFVLGDGPWLDGFACVPTVPASLSVLVGNGTVSAPSTVDATDYGVLAADGHPCVKVYRLADASPLAVPGPGTWLVQATPTEVDTDPAVLQYYNAATPTQALSGPSGNATAQFTRRKQGLTLSVVAGDTAAVGSIPMYALVVPAGAAAITASMISRAPNAPFVDLKLPACAPLDSPFFVGNPRAPTRQPHDDSNSLASTAYVDEAVGEVLADLDAYETKVAHEADVSAIEGQIAAANTEITALRSGRIRSSVFTADDVWTVPAYCVSARVRVVGGGGGSCGSSDTELGAGGGGGGYAEGVVDGLTAGQQVAVTVGAGGNAAGTLAQGGTGGTSSFGGYLAASGGTGGNSTGTGIVAGGGGGSGYGPAASVACQGSDGGDGYGSGVAMNGYGGSSALGGSARAATGQAIAGLFPGGGGAAVYGSVAIGANGAGGIVIVEWWSAE